MINSHSKKHQIVGFSNSGKTTIAKALIEAISRRGLSVGAVKHHGHGGIPLKQESFDTDSAKHRDAGASGSLVISETECSMILSDTSHLNLEDLVRIYECLSFDMIIIEGFKQEKYPKTVIIRSSADEHLLKSCVVIEATIFWEEELALKWESKGLFPVFLMNDLESYIRWFLQAYCRSEG
ncbi:molybdopterin-guanine dinucleotide biosynthesis protein B [Salipaludibacillus sp. CF4.18]|uniref:molybdopterin-guanine dinucleotide biosynthesis protein B n=1 Tax=Salipaludibacillus sp. CF4.18 TaxID=3373081 RepID=UPI003EE53936